MGGTRFMVQWEEHPSHLATRLGQLLEHQTLVDVTLMCNTHTLRVHRAVLAACSPYFETILQRQLGMHPLIVLKDMQFSVLKSLIEFMYCGETSVTEDNLGALLQAAKFFQVKGLSAMTKEALGLVPNAKSAINGDAARKAFVGRPKRVGMQQTFVTSGLKSAAASHASSSHSSTSSTELPTLPTKTTFQTISKPITARPDTQQQTDTAQLLLSLSGSEFPKQTFHTVSKNVRFQHTVSGSTVSVDSPRSSSIDTNAKTKEVVGRIPVMTPNGGKSSVTSTAGTTTVSQQTGQVVEHVTVGSIREDVLVTNPQSVFVSEGHRRRGRPVKRQMNMLFQERVMTDADAALHKEAEASRKALEMLRQEMSSETMETNMSVTPGVPTPISHATAVSSPTTLSSIPNMSSNNVINESAQKGPVKHSVQSTSKLQVQSVQHSLGSSSRTVTSSQNVTSTAPMKKINTNIVYKPSNNPITNIASKKVTSNSVPATDSSNNAVNTVNKVDEPEIPPLYEMSIDSAQDAPKEDNVEYQVSSENVEGESDVNSGNTNVVYQMTDSSNTSAGSVMSQYMEVLKEAGLPTDVPILLDSGDGSYVTVNEEVLMNIVNGGVLQCHVTEGNFVAGDGVEFIVQEITEDEMEAVQAQVQEQTEGEPVSKEIEGSSEITNNVEDIGNIPDVKSAVDLETPLTTECAETVDETKDSNTVEPEHNIENVKSEIQEGEIINQEPFEDEACISPSQEISKIDDVSGELNDTNSEPNLENSDEIKPSIDCPTVNDNENVQAIFESSLCSSDCPSNDNVSEELKNQTHGDEMSVEQALQAMMGDGSDTEIEVHASDEVQGIVKEESEVPGLETVTHTLKEEKSEDLHLVLRSEEGTEEDLRLVLSNDAGDATDDNSNTYSLVSAERVIDHDEGSLVTDNEENVKLCDEVTAALSSDTNQDVGVQECVSETPICESNELENVNEQDDEPKHIIEPLQVEYNANEQPLPPSSSGEEHPMSKLEEAFQENENSEYLESTPGSEISGDSQEVLQLTSNSVASTEAVCNTSEYPKSKGAIISPSKDIPFAVGLLPLKTALEKLQAMPEYHPRKTRSSSTGKESVPDMPAARVKRKSSAADGTDKRFKASPVEESDIIEPPASEEPFDGDTTMEVVASSIPEERKESVLSMPELVTESTEG